MAQALNAIKRLGTSMIYGPEHAKYINRMSHAANLNWMKYPCSGINESMYRIPLVHIGLDMFKNQTSNVQLNMEFTSARIMSISRSDDSFMDYLLHNRVSIAPKLTYVILDDETLCNCVDVNAMSYSLAYDGIGIMVLDSDNNKDLFNDVVWNSYVCKMDKNAGWPHVGPYHSKE